MSAPQTITCPLCGATYAETEGRGCRGGCPVSSGCNLLACPRCGYEVPAQTKLTRWLSRWLGQAAPRVGSTEGSGDGAGTPPTPGGTTAKS
jgi:transposase